MTLREPQITFNKMYQIVESYCILELGSTANIALSGTAQRGTFYKKMSERKHLTEGEVEKLLEATKHALVQKGGETVKPSRKPSRNDVRDRCLLLMMFRHGLRVSEACGLRLDQVDIESRVLHVERLKHGLPTTQPLKGDELRAVKAWLKVRGDMDVPTDVKAFFVSEQRKPMQRSTVNKLLERYSTAAGLPLVAHPHMLRHACGYELANQGADTRLIQDCLGHRNIQHTVRYTASNPARFEKLWAGKK